MTYFGKTPDQMSEAEINAYIAKVEDINSVYLFTTIPAAALEQFTRRAYELRDKFDKADRALVNG